MKICRIYLIYNTYFQFHRGKTQISFEDSNISFDATTINELRRIK